MARPRNSRIQKVWTLLAIREKPGARRGQLSLEALLAFAILLSALSVIIFSATSIGNRLGLAAEEAAEGYSLSYSALCLDEAALSMHHAYFAMAPIAGAEVRGRSITPYSYAPARQHLFFGASTESDDYDVLQSENEPV